MTTSHLALGEYGERLAARFLTERGMNVLARNWRCEHGEIDIVAADGQWLVFVEVKTRRDARFGEPVEAVTWRKVVRLRKLAAAWVAEHRLRPEGIRIDVIGILRPEQGPAQVRHVRGVAS